MIQKLIARRFGKTVVAGLLAFASAGVGGAQKLEMELVYLRDGGFTPSKITRPKGKFILVVKNRSHVDNAMLGITGVGGSILAPTTALVGLNQDYVLDLPATTSVLIDAAHPTWTPLTIVTQ